MDDDTFLIAVDRVNKTLQALGLPGRLRLERTNSQWRMWIEKEGVVVADDIPLLLHSECRGALLGIGIGMTLRALK